MPEEQVRLTRLTHGGGGGCKLAPDILEKILAGIKPGIIPPQLLSGRENSDDAAVYQISAHQAIVATIISIGLWLISKYFFPSLNYLVYPLQL